MDANGVYTLRCRYNNRILVGSALNIIAKRWSKYKSELERGIYCNKLLQEDYNKYGISGFEWTIVEECTDNRREREKYWKDFYEKLGFELYNKNDIKCFDIKERTEEEAERVHINMSNAQRGENNPRARIKEKDAANIKWMLENTNISIKKIAYYYNVKEAQISKIKNGFRWKYVKAKKDINCPLCMEITV